VQKYDISGVEGGVARLAKKGRILDTSIQE
jgi:hypothetical protein